MLARSLGETETPTSISDMVAQMEMGDSDLKIRGNVNESNRSRGWLYIALAISLILVAIGAMVGRSVWIISSRDLGAQLAGPTLLLLL